MFKRFQKRRIVEEPINRSYRIEVFYKELTFKGTPIYRRSFYYSSPNTGDELEEELCRVFNRLEITGIVNYSIHEVAPLVFTSYDLGLGV